MYNTKQALCGHSGAFLIPGGGRAIFGLLKLIGRKLCTILIALWTTITGKTKLTNAPYV